MLKHTRPRVLLLGKDGMLGSAIFRRLRLETSIDLFATSREKSAEYYFDAQHSSLKLIIDELKPHYIINCIGYIRPKLNLASMVGALEVNTFLAKDCHGYQLSVIYFLFKLAQMLYFSAIAETILK